MYTGPVDQSKYTIDIAKYGEQKGLLFDKIDCIITTQFERGDLMKKATSFQSLLQSIVTEKQMLRLISCRARMPRETACKFTIYQLSPRVQAAFEQRE